MGLFYDIKQFYYFRCEIMTNAEILINKYNILEKLLNEKFNIEIGREGAVSQISRYPQFRQLKEELEFIRKIRNFLSHKKTGEEYPIQPSNDVIILLDNVISYIDNPPKAYDSCVKIIDVCAATGNELIFPYMKKMKEKVYTHVPILENGVLKGVFSENTLFGALIEDELIYEKDKTTFSDELIAKYSQINNRASECFEFVKKDCLLEDVRELFQQKFEENKRLAMVFITQNGKPQERVLGIITPWDIMSNRR